MRLGLVISTLLFSTFSVAQENTPIVLNYYNVGACSSWNYIRSDNSVGGYGCFTLPSRVAVPDAFQVSRELNELKRQVVELQNRLQALEQRP